MGLVSDGVFYSFKVPDNGAFMMKITLWFTKLLTYKQDNDIACALGRVLMLPSNRIYTEVATRCNEKVYMPQISESNVFIQTSSKNLYPYMFYIFPDYSVDFDTTNL